MTHLAYEAPKPVQAVYASPNQLAKILKTLDELLGVFPNLASINGSEPVGEHFPGWFFVSSGPAIPQVQLSGHPRVNAARELSVCGSTIGAQRFNVHPAQRLKCNVLTHSAIPDYPPLALVRQITSAT